MKERERERRNEGKRVRSEIILVFVRKNEEMKRLLSQ